VHAQAWPAIGTSQATALAYDWRIYGYGALAVALLVWALILYSAFRFRKRPGHERPRDVTLVNFPLEITWTILPTILVSALFIETYDVERDVEALHAKPPVQIDVNGFRWGWTFGYRGGPTVNGTSLHPVVVELPLGETTAIQLSSSDVVHSFWVPDMLFKRQAIPGMVSAFDLTPTKPGEFVGKCGEFCGLDHTLMLFTVRVVPRPEFERWLKAEQTTT
jgi:cytochrome c oxidase subunit 2